MQMLFYKCTAFPTDYQGDAFATMRGSWNRKTPSGYEIVRIHFEQGRATAIEPFLTGFLTDKARIHFARPVGLAMAKDGALLMADDANGVIYRIASMELPTRVLKTGAPATAMQEQASKGVGVPLALERPETKTKGAIKVSSTTVESGRPIPLMHSEYADGVAPRLSWTAVKDAKSYAVICEDPDAKPTTPFMHWLSWNIPADVTALPEGLQEQARLTEPEGLLQGVTSRGSVGYFGPRPPVGDPPHLYHFQVFALDTVLGMAPGADRDTLLAAMQGHVLAASEVVGTFAQKTKPLK